MEIVIDGMRCEAEYGEYILEIAGRNNIRIPALCHSNALPGQASCRLCIVEVVENNRSKIVTSCVYPVTCEIEVITNSKKLTDMRKTIIMLLSARAPRNGYIDRLREEYGVPQVTRFSSCEKEECVLCGLCTSACDSLGISAISTVSRGTSKKVSTPFDEPSPVCVGCGACASVCPVGAIKIIEANGKRTIWNREFRMVKCSRCGEYYATFEQLEYIRQKLNGQERSSLCEKCRRAVAAQKLKDIYG